MKGPTSLGWSLPHTLESVSERNRGTMVSSEAVESTMSFCMISVVTSPGVVRVIRMSSRVGVE